MSKLSPERVKAEAIVEEFRHHVGIWTGDPAQAESIEGEHAKQCAIIHCKGIIEELEYFNYKLTPVLTHRIKLHEAVLREIEEM